MAKSPENKKTRPTCRKIRVRVRVSARARDNDLAEVPIERCPLKPDTDSVYKATNDTNKPSKFGG